MADPRSAIVYRRLTALAVAAGIVASACGTGSTPAPPSPSRSSSAAGTASASPTAAEPTAGAPGSFDPAAVQLSLRPVAQGLTAPLLVTDPGDGSGRLFVVQQTGQIRIVRDEQVLARPFLDISDRLVSGGEQGLLGLAFHPQYARNGRFFVNYTDVNGDTVVSEFRVSGNDPDVADPTSERLLLGFDQPFANHNGGNLVFGHDGYLYIGTGDGGSGGDPFGNGQSLDTLLGKLLRIDVDAKNAGAYGIPADNPFVDRSGARPEIWAYGLRNPWRFSFDLDTGDLWIADVGQSTFEEIDHVEAGSPGGENFGWNTMEGFSCFAPASGCDRQGLVVPVAVYGHDEGCSVTGGFVYRGERWPALAGAYLFADYCSGTIWALDAGARGRQQPAEMLQTSHAISSFGEDVSGELYLTDLGSGEVFEIVGRPV